MTVNQQRVALLQNETEAQLQNTIEQNFAFASPLVQNRSDAYQANGLPILSNYTNDQEVFWTGALSGFEAALRSVSDPTKRLAMLRTMAALTESMRFDEIERAQDPTITPANITVTSCSFVDVIDLTAQLNFNLGKLTGLLGLASLQQGVEGNVYWTQFYQNVSYLYTELYIHNIWMMSNKHFFNLFCF